MRRDEHSYSIFEKNYFESVEDTFNNEKRSHFNSEPIYNNNFELLDIYQEDDTSREVFNMA